MALAFFALVAILVGGFRRALSGLSASITAFASGAREARAPARSGLTEIDRLAAAYNGMADTLTAAIDRQGASDAELQRVNRALRERGDAIELLGGMAHRMQATRAEDEFSEVLHCFLPRVLPQAPGALYTHNAERNQLVKLAEWGEAQGERLDAFPPDACWGLRRGQSHFLDAGCRDVRCRHVGPGVQGYHCEPILAGGEVVGLLHLETNVSQEHRFRLSALTENVALALVNQRLQRGLRERSIRDGLTELFNRRYMDEALAVELARASRSGRPVGMILCDVDHFKRVNDVHGHDVGDRVLRTVAGALRACVRDGDIACRYGGEEFAVIVPGVEGSDLAAAAERIRAAVKAPHPHQEGRALEPVTVSVGVAVWASPLDGDGADLVRRADNALYRAKQAGRDRVYQDADGLAAPVRPLLAMVAE